MGYCRESQARTVTCWPILGWAGSCQAIRKHDTCNIVSELHHDTSSLMQSGRTQCTRVCPVAGCICVPYARLCQDLIKDSMLDRMQ
mmetsp:Transcript_56115/g.90864  ORF Transcript_56115/g.90864 Transcript_56115/m.90864 type:complete len:86 (+) Transcript_56115:89-346(+)